MILIDIPQIAYKTLSIEVRIDTSDGTRDFWAEMEAEENLKKALSEYPYSSNHDHVR